MGEVYPFRLMQFSRRPREMFGDEIFGVVARTCVTNDPVVDDRFYRPKTAGNDRALILDNHTKTQRWHGNLPTNLKSVRIKAARKRRSPQVGEACGALLLE